MTQANGFAMMDTLVALTLLSLAAGSLSITVTTLSQTMAHALQLEKSLAVASETLDTQFSAPTGNVTIITLQLSGNQRLQRVVLK